MRCEGKGCVPFVSVSPVSYLADPFHPEEEDAEDGWFPAVAGAVSTAEPVDEPWVERDAILVGQSPPFAFARGVDGWLARTRCCVDFQEPEDALLRSF